MDRNKAAPGKHIANLPQDTSCPNIGPVKKIAMSNDGKEFYVGFDIADAFYQAPIKEHRYVTAPFSDLFINYPERMFPLEFNQLSQDQENDERIRNNPKYSKQNYGGHDLYCYKHNNSRPLGRPVGVYFHLISAAVSNRSQQQKKY